MARAGRVRSGGAGGGTQGPNEAMCDAGSVWAEHELRGDLPRGRRAGIKGYDLIGPAEWPILKKYGLIPTMYPPGPGGTIPDALNRKENHDGWRSPARGD